MSPEQSWSTRKWSPRPVRTSSASLTSVSSCSCFTDYQARRLNCRFRDADGKTKLVHTLNGSGVALPRLMVALLEQHQNADGSVTIPEAIRPYMNGQERLEPVGGK